MAEGGGAHSLLDHGSGSLNDSDAEHSLRKVENGGEEDGKDSEDKAEILKEAELADLEKEIEAGETHKEQDKTESLPRWTLSKVMNFVNNVIYGRYVNPRYLNILTDLADAEAFLIDGDSLLLELLTERSLDWSSGGQFLHLTYLFERFLQFFKDKDVVFHIIFFKDMQVIWSSEPSMLLARQAIILHLQHNTPFTVVTNIKNFWGRDWMEYVEQKSPAFLLLTDAEKISLKIQPKKKMAVEFFFRTLLLHTLHMDVNCVFICGIELTNSKVMGFYTESSPVFMNTFRRVGKPGFSSWLFLMRYWNKEAQNDFGAFGEDGLRDEVQRALQSSVQENCRVLASRLACTRVMKKVADSPDFKQESKKSTEDGIKLFLLHTILLDKLPLKFRSHAVSNGCLEQFSLRTDGKVHPFREIQVSLWKVLKLLSKPYPFVASTENPLDMSVVSDIMDGRLILKLLSVTLERRSQGLEALSLPEAVIREAETLWKQVCDDVNKSKQSYAVGSHFLPLFAEDWTDFEPFEDESFKWDDSSKPRRLLDVKNDLVDVYSGDLKSKLNALAEGRIGEEPPNIGREFEEKYHWHSLKPLSDDYDMTRSDEAQPPSDPRERFWFFKNKQQFASFQRFYGNSLEGSIDRAQIITVSNTGTEKKKEKSLPSKKAQQIIEENKEKHKEKEKKRDQERLTHFLKAVDQNLKNSNHDGALQLIDTFQASCNSPEFHLQALIKKLACCWDAWQDKRSCDSKSSDMTFPVLLMETVHKITDGFGHLLTVKDKKKLAQYMQKLGFADIASMFCELSADTGKKSENLSVHTTSARFQMELMGHLLKRDERSDRDPRVDHFIPDTWQRELLDAVDKKESAVIVAPTSSGKTFASYYCMENVLRESNEGVVVYVSPTKALVNQVAATIYARFSQKKLPEGRAVYGVFTRDYRHNTLNSQILVTVPQCLEILLLSPRRQDWAKNLKYVIFDEAHCLGQEGDGEVWEHLLLLIRCPFLALSATIGNPEGLRTWLQNAQDFRKQQDIQDNVPLRGSYRVRLVTYAERYSDLEKSIYLPSPKDGSFSEKSEKYESKYDVKRTEDFVRLHPCAQVGIKQLQDNGFPGDMALTPKESLQLYDVMVAQWPDKESLLQLAPEKYFQQTKLIQKNDARLYENKVKKELKSWADDQHLEKVKNVIYSLNSVCQEKMASTEEEWSEVDVFSTGREFIMNNFVKLIEQLRAQEKLPALVFSFDRSMCEELSEKLTEEFERRENELKTNPGSKYFEKLKELEKKREQEVKQAKKSKDKEKPSSRESADRTLCGIITQKNLVQHQMRDNKLKTNPGSKCFEKLEELEKKQKRDSKQGARCKEKPGARESMESQLEGQDKDDFSLLDKPLPECSLACTNVIGNDTLNKIMDRVHYLDETEVFKRALPRGMSYHHSGLNAKERACVEMLFRQKYLQVVTATSTLALGIHMPCKTVVFAGDSPFLNSLMYRQMSGRAGRRGFDPVGNVVFFGLPYSKIQRLITANIPKLVGNFPISVSLVLRLLLMTSKGDDKKDALTKALTLLSHPFICQQEPHMGGQIKKHFLFSVEFLARLSLINLSGVPQEMAGLATHLHYHEPSNFVLVSFLQRGLFHRLCKPNESGQFSQDVMRKIVLVLSHLFGRRKLHPSFKRRIHLCPSSKVLLQDLPKQFADAVQEYNQQVTGVFKQYLTTVAAELKEDKGEENTLPLSGIVFQGQKDIDACEHDTISKLVRSSIPSSACSAFAALSGNSENRLHRVDRSRTSLFEGSTDNDEDEDEGEDDNEDDNKDESENEDEKEHEDGNVDGSDTEDKESDEGFNFGTEQGDIDQPVPIGQLLKIVRQDVYTDMNIVPIFELEPRLNAYALDFFKHGSSKAILKENRLQSGEVFHLLKDFNLTIKSISCSLEELGPEKDNVVLAFKQLQEEYGEKFDKTYSRQ